VTRRRVAQGARGPTNKENTCPHVPCIHFLKSYLDCCRAAIFQNYKRATIFTYGFAIFDSISGYVTGNG
jgi:hypothetical protein